MSTSAKVESPKRAKCSGRIELESSEVAEALDHECSRRLLPASRRAWLRNTVGGFGYLALMGLAQETSGSARQGDSTLSGPLSPKRPHFQPKAKRVIFLCMQGGPSHIDTFDYKPRLQADDGKPGKRDKSQLLGSPWKFQRYGDSGQWVSDLFPNVGQLADELCFLRGMQAKTGNHQQAHIQLHTGSAQFVRPSLGAWVLYGLGCESQNLPGFVSISPPPSFSFGGAQNYGSAFLPAVYQGTRIRDPLDARIPQIQNQHLPDSVQRRQLDLVRSMNQQLLARQSVADDNLAVEGLINSFELGYRMQATVPQVMDLSVETELTRRMYGVDQEPTDRFGRQCLYARRLAEQGVRFIELTHNNWDQHGNLRKGHADHCRATDQPIAALLSDLKQRGLLEDTLVVWGGEFGRTPDAQLDVDGGVKDGRDHNPDGFTFWMAGGGVKPGFSYGKTDDYGYEAVEGKIGIHDLHATILHLLGLDHERLTFRYSGRDFRLTDVHGEVIDGFIGV